MRGIVYTNIDTDTTVLIGGGKFHGVGIFPLTTGACSVYVYDASTTAAGTLIFAASAASTAGIGMNNPLVIGEGGVSCRAGIHANVTCTSGADQIVIYYSKS